MQCFGRLSSRRLKAGVNESAQFLTGIGHGELALGAMELQSDTAMKTKTANNRGSSKLTCVQERELEEHAIHSYLMHLERGGVDTHSVMQPASGTTNIDQR